MSFIGIHGGPVPMGHGFERLIFVVKGGFGVYVHDIWHRVDGGPHGVGGNVPVVKVSYPFQGYEVPIFVWDSGIGGAAVVIGFKPVGTGVHVVRYFEFFLDSIFKLLDTESLFVLCGKVVKVSLLKGCHESPYNPPKHVCGEPRELVSAYFSGSGRKGDGWRFSHNS